MKILPRKMKLVLVLTTVLSYWGCDAGGDGFLEKPAGNSRTDAGADTPVDTETDSDSGDPVLPDIPPRDVFFYCPTEIAEPFDFIFVRSVERGELSAILDDIQEYAESIVDQDQVQPCSSSEYPVIPYLCEYSETTCEVSSYSTPMGRQVSYSIWSTYCETGQKTHSENFYEIFITSTQDSWQSLRFSKTVSSSSYGGTGGSSSSVVTEADWQGDIGMGLPANESLSSGFSATAADACGAPDTSWTWGSNICGAQIKDNCMQEIGPCYGLTYYLWDPYAAHGVVMDSDCLIATGDECCVFDMWDDAFTRDYWQSCTP